MNQAFKAEILGKANWGFFFETPCMCGNQSLKESAAKENISMCQTQAYFTMWSCIAYFVWHQSLIDYVAA